MKSNCKFLYLIAAFVTFKLFILTVLLKMGSNNSGFHLPFDANSMQYLFQILFFLLIISPPLIVVFLYLIWKELKTRNKLK